MGVNIISSSDANTMPRMRRDGPIAVPGTFPLRRISITQTTTHSSITNTPNRRASEPSGEIPISESQRSRSSNQATLGPRAVRTRVDSSTVASV